MEKIEEAKSLLKKIHSYDPDSIERKDELGAKWALTTLSVKAAKAIQVYRMIEESSLIELPELRLDTFITDTKEFINWLGDCERFDPKENNAVGIQENLERRANEILDRTYSHFPMIVNLSQSKVIDLLDERQNLAADEVRHELNDATEKFKALSATLNDLIASSAEKINDTISAAQEAAAKAGVQFQASKFSEEAKDHEDAATNWFIGLAFATAILIFWAIGSPWIYQYAEKQYGEIDSHHLIAAKITAFAVLSFVVIVSARNYSAHRHNAVLNKHRQNALQTYRAMVEASGDEKNREAILQHAAACIFGVQSTGYIRPDNAVRQPTINTVVETFASRAIDGP